MGLRVDVGIDAEGDGRDAPRRRGARVDAAELGPRLGVEELDARGEGGVDLGVGLPDPGVDDARRVGARAERPEELAAGGAPRRGSRST
jgi:hypothetical protein